MGEFRLTTNDPDADAIILNNEVVPYKYHIRKIVEAATIHESDKWEEYQKGRKIMVENPTTKEVIPPIIYVLALAVILFAGAVIKIIIDSNAI